MAEADDRERLPLANPDHPRGFEFDAKAGTLDLYWHGTSDPYWIYLDRINTPEKALGWLSHMGEKTWKGMTPARIAELIEALAHRNGWNVHGM